MQSQEPRNQYLQQQIAAVINILRQATQQFTLPLVDQIIEEYGRNPYLILISCLLSLRVRDTTTIHVCHALFARVTTPAEMVVFDRQELERLVFKTGFYKTKARILQEVSRELLQRFDGKVPRTVNELMSIRGVGPKTAHLVVGLAYDIPAICVDTHVHRISNRLGLITTKTAEETEEALRNLLPKEYWVVWNKLLVMWGQNVCTPLSPHCTRCPVFAYCKRVGVKSYR